MNRNEEPLPAPVRARLLSLGLPAEKHVPHILSGLFPDEFNIGSTNLDTEDLARVLVHLAERGIISVSEAPHRTFLKDVAPGWHSCQFYRSFDQLLDLVAPYIAAGLRNAEGCLWVVPDVVRSQSAQEAIGRFLNPVERYVESGQLEIFHRSWYLDSAGRLKSFEEIAEALLGRQERALAKGFKSLRAAGDTGWISGSDQSKDFIDYEMKVNGAIGATKVAAICTYRADVTADELVNIVIAHQDALCGAAAN